MISIKNLSFKYDYEDENAKEILKDINLEIKEGEFVALLGHNGSGKSTLAKLINGLLLPGQGDVLVDWMNTKSEEEIWDIRRTAGMVFQNPDNQLVATIVEDEVAFGPENMGIEPSEIRQRVDSALEDVGMAEYKKNAPHLLSGGQKQRVAIAGILAMSPKYIILDEPTAMLDPSGRREVIDTLVKLNKEEGKTIILITHYMEEAAISDRVVVMEDGNMVLSGTPREVFSQVDKIKGLGLDVPQVTELAYELKKDGFDISGEVLNIEEMVKEICH
ncbi:energy-coupling factor transporter ATPase [Peptoniphilus harei]|uniref:energy-coupling factor transporter ATPase n=1 Tax=Peptoniphilus harei TaxID=54005 RepID=UPI0029139B76|nr:energy-coupling factor transporter ATPase [Peptoniphilus harei]MDU5417109.1 energy-coupling factor transporter ATPase [Peptoniphilus harei]